MLLYVMRSCLHIDTLQRYEPEKFDKAMRCYEVSARVLPRVLYFNKGL